MDKQTSKVILDVMQNAQAILSESIFLVKDKISQDEMSNYKKSVGRAMGEIFSGIIMPIIENHPDLTPDYLRPSDEDE